MRRIARRISSVIITFDDLELDDELFELRKNGARVDIQRRALDLLIHLVRHRHRVVLKRELIDVVWEGVAVSPNAIVQAVVGARRAIEVCGGPVAIATVRGRGYRFLRPASERAEAALPLLVMGGPIDDEALRAGLGAFGPTDRAERVVIDAGATSREPLALWNRIASACIARHPALSGWSDRLGGPYAIDAVVDVLREASALAPLAVIIRDVERADVSSLSLLPRIAQLLSGQPVLFAATCDARAMAHHGVIGSILRDLAAVHGSTAAA
jgi:DNA-binding winged helix-turn-helix (wHTH) protein